ncbi:MAG: riboflavin biosynthesis protein RibA [Lysobacteraceae bacterium]|nr:MAG: riboflavin biosynthesis protein RibA [Xanthomonadaceae bacterium]
MSTPSPLSGELSNSKVAAVFRDPAAARAAADGVAVALSLESAQVQLLTPGEPYPGRKLEPESRGIWRTIVRAHVRLGLVGAGVGLLVFAALHAYGLPLIVNSPVAAGFALLFFGTIAGLMLGGLVALRPDHDRYVEAARDAMDAGSTTVVIHAFSSAQAGQAAEFLRVQGGEVTSTL